MTINEAFERWKKSAPKEYSCVNGVITGGQGYYGFAYCRKHSNVRYGHDVCPKKCKDFCKMANGGLFDAFMFLYHNYPDAYNKKFNIDEDDPLYKRGWDEDLHNFIQYGEIKEPKDPTEVF